jgi:Lrp/AsnC family transcriptional regulator for asnA, asnC and gidA
MWANSIVGVRRRICRLGKFSPSILTTGQESCIVAAMTAAARVGGQMRAKIDDLDRAIIACLQENSRMPCTEIASRIGNVPARTVRSRLKRLLDRGVIDICTGVIPGAVGFPIRADIMIRVEAGKLPYVVEKLSELDQVYYLALSTGDCDISIATAATDLESLQSFITETLHSIPGITTTRVNVLTSILRQSYDWALPEDLP